MEKNVVNLRKKSQPAIKKNKNQPFCNKTHLIQNKVVHYVHFEMIHAIVKVKLQIVQRKTIN